MPVGSQTLPAESTEQRRCLTVWLPTQNLWQGVNGQELRQVDFAEGTIGQFYGSDDQGYFVLPPDYLQKGGVEAYGPDAGGLSNDQGRGAFENLLRQHLLAGRVDGTTAARILDPVSGTHGWR